MRSSETTASCTMCSEGFLDETEGTLYFGIGPIVNSRVRKRQNVKVTDCQAAILPDYRHNFLYGGIVNIVPSTGWEVHGILMKFANKDDWTKFCSTNAGQNHTELHEVFTYEEPDDPVLANVFVLHPQPEETKSGKKNKPDFTDRTESEALPTERYLKLIAQGMREHQVDDDFIQDQILNVPFVSARQKEDYLTFPSVDGELPTISFSKYQKMCEKSKTAVYFVIRDSVFKMDKTKTFSRTNPGVTWFLEHCHGKGDLTLLVHQTITDPDIPDVSTREELTDDHFRWSENQSVEFLGNCGVTATKVYELLLEDTDKTTNKASTTKRISKNRLTKMFKGNS